MFILGCSQAVPTAVSVDDIVVAGEVEDNDLDEVVSAECRKKLGAFIYQEYLPTWTEDAICRESDIYLIAYGHRRRCKTRMILDIVEGDELPTITKFSRRGERRLLKKFGLSRRGVYEVIKVDLNPILKVKDFHGKALQEFKCSTSNPPCSETFALNPTTTYQLNNILSDNAARTPAFGAHSVLSIPNHQVAVKTGTTQNLRDNWTIGYTQNAVVLVWVGNNDNTPMSYVASGITGASPIWRRITDTLLQNQPPHQFPEPAGLVKVSVCTLTGELACSGCPSRDEYFAPGTQPQRACSPQSIEALKQKYLDEKQRRDQILEGTSTP